MHELVRLTNAWLISEPKTLTPIERVIMDRFMRSLPYEAKKLAYQQNPQSVDQLVELLEGYQATQGVLRSGRPENMEAPTCPKKRQPEEVPSSKPTPEAPWSPNNPDHRRCYKCGEATSPGTVPRGGTCMSLAASEKTTG